MELQLLSLAWLLFSDRAIEVINELISKRDKFEGKNHIFELKILDYRSSRKSLSKIQVWLCLQVDSFGKCYVCGQICLCDLVGVYAKSFTLLFKLGSDFACW